MCAYVEALSQAPAPADVIVVSIGTGQAMTPIRYHDAKGWGRFGWAPRILDVVFDGVSDTIDYQLTWLLRPAGVALRRYRLQAELAPGQDALDDARPANIARLKGVGAEIVRQNDAAITALARELAR